MGPGLTFSVGYQYPDEGGDRFPAIVADYADHVSEAYFAPGNLPSARTPAADASGLDEESAEAIQSLSDGFRDFRKGEVRVRGKHSEC